jgi:hypothetical protein
MTDAAIPSRVRGLSAGVDIMMDALALEPYGKYGI